MAQQRNINEAAEPKNGHQQWSNPRGKVDLESPRLFSMICVIFFIGSVCFLWSCKRTCSRNIDTMIKECYYSNDTIIKLSDLFPEEWDTVYFFGACSAKDIEKRTGPIIYSLWCDVGDKMLILNKNKKVVYYKEWDMYYGQDLEGAIFRFNSDSMIIAIARRDAKFLIRKRDENSFWVMQYGDEDSTTCQTGMIRGLCDHF